MSNSRSRGSTEIGVSGIDHVSPPQPSHAFPDNGGINTEIYLIHTFPCRAHAQLTRVKRPCHLCSMQLYTILDAEDDTRRPLR